MVTKRGYHPPTWRRVREILWTLTGGAVLVWEVSDRSQPVRTWVIAAALALLGIQPAALLDDWLSPEHPRRQPSDDEDNTGNGTP